MLAAAAEGDRRMGPLNAGLHWQPVGTFRFKSDLRNHQAIVQPRLYDSLRLMVTQITLTPSQHA